MFHALGKLLQGAGQVVNRDVLQPIHKVEAGIGRQVNPFDGGASYANPQGGNAGTSPMPPMAPMNRPVTVDPLPYSNPVAPVHNQVPFFLHGGVPYYGPGGTPVKVDTLGLPLNDLPAYRAIPMNPQDELYRFPQQNLMKLINPNG